MGAGTIVSVAEYLSTLYEPDMDYVDGVLEERNVGELDHSKIQKRLLSLLDKAGFEYAYPGLRLRISARRYRVPDVSVFLEGPTEQVPSVAPALAIEVLSPEDRIGRMQSRLGDYRTMGCPCVWLIDPQNKRVYLYAGTSLTGVEQLTHPTVAELSLGLTELF